MELPRKTSTHWSLRSAIGALTLIVAQLLQPLTPTLLAADFEFTPFNNGKLWYGFGASDFCQINPPIPEFANNWGEKQCTTSPILPPKVPHLLDDVDLKAHTVELEALATVQSLQQSEGGDFKILAGGGFLGVTSALTANGQMTVLGGLSVASLIGDATMTHRHSQYLRKCRYRSADQRRQRHTVRDVGAGQPL